MWLVEHFNAKTLTGDIRASAVGALVSTMWTLLLTWLLTPTTLTFSAFPNEDGFTQPLPLLVEAAKVEDESLTISFEPAKVRDTYVCEYAQLTGATSRELLLTYVERFQMCFAIRQIQEDEFIVRVNERSGEMILVDGDWVCKCSK